MPALRAEYGDRLPVVLLDGASTATGRSTSRGCVPIWRPGRLTARCDQVNQYSKFGQRAGHTTTFERRGDEAMSVLLFGVSHRSAPVSVLEQLSTDESDQAKIVDQVLQSSLVTEAMVLSTCNRVEVYAVVEAFHGGLSVIGQVLVRALRHVAGRPDQVRLRALRRGRRRAPLRGDQRAGLRGDRRAAGARPGAPRRMPPPRPTRPSAAPCTNWPSARCRSASGCTPRPGIDAAGASVVSVALDMADTQARAGWQAAPPP